MVDDCISRKSKRTELNNAQRGLLLDVRRARSSCRWQTVENHRTMTSSPPNRDDPARLNPNTIHSNRDVPWPSDGIEDGVLTRPNTRMTIAIASRTAPPIAIAIPIEALFGRPRIAWRRNPPATPPMPLNNARDARRFTDIDNVV